VFAPPESSEEIVTVGAGPPCNVEEAEQGRATAVGGEVGRRSSPS
jgi:hypothetical protein